jgi:hypothetical protein
MLLKINGSMQMTDQFLKPCAFCGGEGKVESIKFKHENGDISYKYWCECTNSCCTLVRGCLETKEIAIKKWNTRAESEKYKKLLELVKEMAQPNFLEKRIKGSSYIRNPYEIRLMNVCRNKLKEIGEL